MYRVNYIAVIGIDVLRIKPLEEICLVYNIPDINMEILLLVSLKQYANPRLTCLINLVYM